MFEPAVQSPAETMDAAGANAAATKVSRQSGDQVNSARRYTAEDFRALLAQLSKGVTTRPGRPRSTASSIVLPQFVPWRPCCAPPAAAERPAELEPNAISRAPAPEDEPEPNGGAADRDAAGSAQPAEAGPDDAVIADPLPPDDTFAMADVPVDEPVAEPADMSETATLEMSSSGSPDEEPQEHSPPAIEAAEMEPTDFASGCEAEGTVTAVQSLDPVVADPDNASEPDTAFDPDLQSAETARTLLDIMSMPSGAVQPQERALAGDTLLRLVSRMPVASLIALCDRICIMEAPPPLLVRRLIHHENVDVAGSLLERCPGISDQDLMTMINMGDVVTLKLIARRRNLSPALTDALIRHGDASVLLTVVRNPGAGLSHEAFNVLAEAAKSRTSLQAPLATRADTPAPIAFELFWSLPPQLRRYVLSRFLTESATLDRILKIAHRLEEPNGSEGNGNPRTADKAGIEELVNLIAAGKTTEAAHKLAALAGISEINAERIITDSEGEPLTVAMKAIELSRTQFAAAAETLRDAPAAPLRSNRRIAELQNLFDSLSFTKARVLLTYWDWAVEQSGPYSGKAI
ncbi:MAG TPA: DUF2336 domain-containing protein [Aestuariivirgaceae bacterium]|nr:DUF2336 domain-containing protein [Aestuariivirgaceae bacterium]